MVEAAPCVRVLAVTARYSPEFCAIGNTLRARGQSWAADGLDTGNAHAGWLLAVREWHAFRESLNGVFKSTWIQPGYQVDGAAATGAFFAN